MGRLHRIRKRLKQILSEEPLKPGTRYIPGGYVYIGKRQDGSVYVVPFGNAYRKFIRKLENETEVAHSDKAPAKE